MSLREDIKPYLDVYGLVAPQRCDPTTRGSDNGMMFTSEYYIMLMKRGELIPIDIDSYKKKVYSCMTIPGLLCRAPGDYGQEGPDDYLGVLAGAKILELPNIAQMIIDYGWSTRGVFNNETPRKFTWASLLIRQPQLIAAAYAASGRVPFFAFPFFLYAALVILYAGIRNYNLFLRTDERRLCWLLIQCVAPVSGLCRLASRVWYWKLNKDYGPLGMKAVASYYYHDNHPFQRYWVDEV